MRVLDLFCGCGGFSEGFRQAGHEIVAGVDNWGVALASFKGNHPEAKIVFRDVMRLDLQELPDAEIVIGSPPCVEYSIANLRKGNEANTTLLDRFLEIVTELGPRYWVMEEVPLVTKYLPNGIPYLFLQANWYGLKHKRRRLFAGKFPKPKRGLLIKPTVPTPVASEWKGLSSGRMARYADTLGRIPSPKEVAEVMGFPSHYRFAGSVKDQLIQIGNAVCPPVSRGIAEGIEIH